MENREGEHGSHANNAAMHATGENGGGEKMVIREKDGKCPQLRALTRSNVNSYKRQKIFPFFP